MIQIIPAIRDSGSVFCRGSCTANTDSLFPPKQVGALPPEQMTPIEDEEKSDESRKRLAEAGSSDGEEEPKRAKLVSAEDTASSQEPSDGRESGDKMYLSLIGDEVCLVRTNGIMTGSFPPRLLTFRSCPQSNGNDTDRSPTEPMLTDQQEDSLLGEEPAEALHAGEQGIEDDQSALDSDNDRGSKDDTSQATLPLAESGTENDAQPSDTADKIVPNTLTEETSSSRHDESENEQSETGATRKGSTKETESHDHGSRAEKSARSQ